MRRALTAAGLAAGLVALAVASALPACTSAEAGRADRLTTRHERSFIETLPRRYADEIKAMAGVKAVTWMTWFGGQDPRDKGYFFGSFAVAHQTLQDVFPEIELDPEVRKVWLADKQAAIVGEDLARRLKLEAGDKIRLTSEIWKGDWEFRVAGSYRTRSRFVDQRAFFCHWEYLNEYAPELRRDRVGWIVTRIDDPGRGAALAKQIDALFAGRDAQTLTQTEQAWSNQNSKEKRD